MPIIKSAKKRQKTALKATIRNFKTKRKMKKTHKDLVQKVSLANLSKYQSAIDQSAKKNVIHKKKASRLKSRASKIAKQSGLKIAKKASLKSTTKKA